jgi:hypothetical protein
VLSLTVNVADPAVYKISGIIPLEAEIHIKVFTMFGNIRERPFNLKGRGGGYVF